MHSRPRNQQEERQGSMQMFKELWGQLVASEGRGGHGQVVKGL